MVDRIATLGVAIAENVSKIDRVLDDIRLFLQHIDRRVCNDQRFEDELGCLRQMHGSSAASNAIRYLQP
jgi:hypothetical protein